MRTARLPLPTSVTESLARFGAGLRRLRARRRMPMTYVAERASISRSTLHRMERGDPRVALGLYAAVLASYGMLDRLEALVDSGRDRAGLALDEARLPRRVRARSAREDT